MTSLQKTKIAIYAFSGAVHAVPETRYTVPETSNLECVASSGDADSRKKLTGSSIDIVRDLMQPSAETFLKSSAAMLRGHNSCCRQRHACI